MTLPQSILAWALAGYAVVAFICVSRGIDLHLGVASWIAERLRLTFGWLYRWSVRVDAAISAGADQYAVMLDKQEKDGEE